MNACASCGRRFAILEGMIGDEHYCHAGESPTCYEKASAGEWREFDNADDAIAWLESEDD